MPVIITPYVDLRLVSIRGLDLNGLAPTISVTESGTRFPDAETLALSGQAPSAIIAESVEPSAGSTALSGKQPVALRGSLVITPYTDLRLESLSNYGLTLEGHQPSIEIETGADVVREPSESTLVLGGKQPSAEKSYVASPAALSTSLAGEQPSAEQSHVASPAALSTSLAGEQPSAEQSHVASPAALSTSLAGEQPSAEQSHVASPVALSMALAGEQPAAGLELTPLPQEGALALAGQAVGVIAGDSHLVPLPAGELTLDIADFELLQEDGFAIELEDGSGSIATEAPVTIIQAAYRVPSNDTLNLGSSQPATITTISVGVLPQFSLDGYAPTFVQQEISPTIPVPQEQLALGSAAPSRVRGFSYEISVDRAQLAFDEKVPERATGLDLRGHAPAPDIQQGENKTRSPAASLFTLDGKSVTRIQEGPTSITVPVPRRQYFLVGYPSALTIIDLTAEASFTLEPYPPTSIASSPTFFPTEEALTLTPKLPFLRPIIDIDAETLALSGSAPSVEVSDNEQPSTSVGAITLAGQAPQVFSTPIALPDAGSVALTGEEVNLGRSITPPAVARRLRGKVPTRTDFGADFPFTPGKRTTLLESTPYLFTTGFNIPSANEALSLSGAAPSVFVETDSLKIPGRVALSLTPGTPVSGGDVVRVPDAGAFILNGKDTAVQERRVRRDSARKRFVRLTTNRSIELLYR